MGPRRVRPAVLAALGLLAACGSDPWADDPPPDDVPFFELSWTADEGEPLSFGSVRREERVTRTTTVHNGGSVDVLVDGVLGPGGGFTLDEDPPVEVPAGGSAEVTVAYSPWFSESVAGFLELRYRPNVGTSPTLAARAQGLAASLEWTVLADLPEATEPECVHEVRLRLESSGLLPVTITDFGFEDEEGFTLTQAPDLPFTLDPGASAEVALTWSFPDVGTAIDRLVPVTEPEYAADPGPYLQGVALFQHEVFDTFAPADELVLSEAPWVPGIGVIVDSAPWTDWTYAADPPRVVLDSAALPSVDEILVVYASPRGCAAPPE